MGEWKLGDPLTPAMKEKAKRTREETKSKARVSDVRTALRRYMGMSMADLTTDQHSHVFEHIAKGLIALACNQEGGNQLKAIQDVMDRLYGRAKTAPDLPQTIESRSTLRRTLPAGEGAEIEATLRKMGLDDEADRVAEFNDGQEEQGEEGKDPERPG